jgi:hypothetical protein
VLSKHNPTLGGHIRLERVQVFTKLDVVSLEGLQLDHDVPKDSNLPSISVRDWCGQTEQKTLLGNDGGRRGGLDLHQSSNLLVKMSQITDVIPFPHIESCRHVVQAPAESKLNGIELTQCTQKFGSPRTSFHTSTLLFNLSMALMTSATKIQTYARTSRESSREALANKP